MPPTDQQVPVAVEFKTRTKQKQDGEFTTGEPLLYWRLGTRFRCHNLEIVPISEKLIFLGFCREKKTSDTCCWFGLRIPLLVLNLRSNH